MALELYKKWHCRSLLCIVGSVYVPRLVDQLIADLIASVPAVLVTGPRACGKTTTSRNLARSVIRLDRPDQAAAARADVDVALTELDEPLLIDEWQFVPEILGAVKRAVDEQSRPGRFVLTGSVSSELGSAASSWEFLRANFTK